MKNTTRRIVATTTDELTSKAATWLAEKIAEAVTARGRCSVALAGGSTPKPVYVALARAPHAGRIAWEKVDFFLGDERCVKLEDVASNFRMARLAFEEGGGARPLKLHAMAAGEADSDRVARDYEAALPDPLDIVLLGIGEDGHVASLFPGSPALREKARRVIPADGPKPPTRRITITPGVIEKAREVVVLAAGAGKATAVKAALEGALDVERVPAQLARKGTWILDAPAASQLA